MTTTTPSRAPEARRRARGFTLVEVLIGSTLGSFILLGVLTTFLFLGRSGANLRNYSDMEAQARKALETFAEDTRQASAVTWNSANSVTLVVNSTNITYAYIPSSGTFTRTSAATTTLLSGITSFSFLAYSITGTAITDYSTSSARTIANGLTKQIQISLSAARSTTTVSTATNIVLSARYVMRNKHVTA
jgi:prepilin-type N-terminal cleavage/methylation domain-containing protein